MIWNSVECSGIEYSNIPQTVLHILNGVATDIVYILSLISVEIFLGQTCDKSQLDVHNYA